MICSSLPPSDSWPIPPEPSSVRFSLTPCPALAKGRAKARIATASGTVAIRALAIPLAKAGHGVKEKLTELGYGGIGQLSEGGNEEHIKTFYAWLLEETKSLK